MKPSLRNTYFKPRLTKPSAADGEWVLKYYNNAAGGGFNPCITGGGAAGTDSECNVLANCVGYAVGRFNEIGNYGECKYLTSCHAKNMINRCGGMPIGGINAAPEVGAAMVWEGGTYGHIAIIEQVISPTQVVVSDSSWATDPRYAYVFRTATCTFTGSNWKIPGYSSEHYTFIGFIYNPAVSQKTRYFGDSYDYLEGYYDFKKAEQANTPTTGGAQNYKSASAASNALRKTYISAASGNSSGGGNSTKLIADSSLSDTEYTRNGYKLVTTSGSSINTKRANLLSYPAYVESPFIELKIGEYTFGTYSKESAGNIRKVQYPNYLTRINIVKINGAVNTYSINMEYQVEAGADPNLIDKILASVGYNTIKISYGDWSTPKYIYKEEEALITKVTSNVDFASSKIIYTLECTSNILLTASTVFDFPKFTGKPSDKIKEILYNKMYKLTDIFQGMADKSTVDIQGFIIGDDKSVEVEAKSLDPLSYINYLVTCMVSNTNTSDSPVQDSSYYLTLEDDLNNEFGGSYFKIHKVLATGNVLNSADTYEIDIGYPGDNLVTSFNITDNNSWALLYDYAQKLDINNYIYTIDKNGDIKSDYSLNITTSKSKKKTTAENQTWWTQMTQFPINATLVIKGLIRPVMLMTYLRVNAMFYGQKHISSGLYIITKQEDTVDKTGYRTTLSLMRVAGDNDVFIKQS